MGELESIEDVIARHQRRLTDGGPCLCGAWPPPEHDVEWPTHLADRFRAHLAEVAGRDEVREAMAKAVLADAFAKDRTAVTWDEADHEWLRDDADAAVGAYLQAIGDDK